MVINEVRNRLESGLAALGVNMKQASLAAGLSHTYVRDVLKRGRGKYENLEKVAAAVGLSWEWLRTGNGEMMAKSAAIAAQPVKVPEAILIDPLKLTKLLEAAFRRLGATELQAAGLAEIVLLAAEVPETSPSARATKSPQTTSAPFSQRS